MKSRRFYRRRGTVLFRIICAVLAVLISVLLIDAKLRPAIYDLAVLEAYALSAKTVNAAVEKTLEENAPEYSDLADISRTDDGRITGITTDVIKLNLFKAQVTKAIDSAFNEKKKTEISVPLGSASGIALFADFFSFDSAAEKASFPITLKFAHFPRSIYSIFVYWNAPSRMLFSLEPSAIVTLIPPTESPDL